MDAPVVGLTTYRQQAAWGVWSTRADLLPTEYAVAVEAAGERFRLAVQWHPETRVEIGLMAGLVRAASDHGR